MRAVACSDLLRNGPLYRPWRRPLVINAPSADYAKSITSLHRAAVPIARKSRVESHKRGRAQRGPRPWPRPSDRSPEGSRRRQSSRCEPEDRGQRGRSEPAQLCRGARLHRARRARATTPPLGGVDQPAGSLRRGMRASAGERVSGRATMSAVRGSASAVRETVAESARDPKASRSEAGQGPRPKQGPSGEGRDRSGDRRAIFVPDLEGAVIDRSERRARIEATQVAGF